MQAIGYYHKLRFRVNPIREMNRLQNIMKGARREKGPCERKLPVTVEDLNRIYDKVDWASPDSVTIWCTISIAWFFMLRMGGYLEKRTRDDQNNEYDARHPLQTDVIEPTINGMRSYWSDDVDEIAIYISGSKTDWLNQGMVRSHNLIPEGAENSKLSPVRSLAKLWKLCPAKFERNNERVFASWRSGKPIKPDIVLSLLRMAIFEQGMCPNAFSLHSLRAGGRQLYTGQPVI